VYVSVEDEGTPKVLARGNRKARTNPNLGETPSRNPHDKIATDGYGAIHRQYPPGFLSLTLLDLGVN